MNQPIFAPKLQKGDTVRVVAPSLSMSIISEDTRKYAKKVFEEDFGLNVTFSKNIEESDEQNSSSTDSRISDIHEAFSDKNVKAIISIIGGFNSNQLLDRLDWELIKTNPKIVCGYSDTTALLSAIQAKTGLVTYYGPAYSTFGQKHLDSYTAEYFIKCLFNAEPYKVLPSTDWTDDQWYNDQDNRKPINGDGWWVISPGETQGQIVGGNLCTLNLLQGTDFMPGGQEVILFIEDDAATNVKLFGRDLQSLLQTHYFHSIKGVVIGRFQSSSKVTIDALSTLINATDELKNVPVVANVDFGHTEPKITFPLGGSAALKVGNSDHSSITVLKH